MVSPKPKWGSQRLEPVDFPVTDQELENLIENFKKEFSNFKIPFSPADNFKKYLRRLIAIYRTASANKQERPKPNELSEELKRLKKIISTMYQKFDTEAKDKISDTADYLLTMKKIKYGGTDDLDPIYTMCMNAEAVIFYIDEILSEMSSKASGRLEEKTRELMAEELARLFHTELNYQPTKTRDGLFYNCIKHFFESIKDQKHKVSVPVIEDYFDIISKAIDSYPTKDSKILVDML